MTSSPIALEAARLELQQRLDGARPPSERNRMGQFATPAELAGEIVAYALTLMDGNPQIRYLEPGFGTGSFYSALLRLAPHKRITAAAGYEIDRYYAEPLRQLWEGTGLRLNNGDFMACEPPKQEAEKYNLIACNPPYVRHHHLSETQKRDLRTTLAHHIGVELNGLSGLYTYFMLLSQAWMSAGGVGAWLIPSEFMDVNYGRKVKEFLSDKVTLQRIHRFDPNDVQFGDALVSSAVVFFVNRRPPAGHKVEFSFGGPLLKPRMTKFVGLAELRGIAKWTALPQAIGRHKLSQGGQTLADLFTIKRGLATGSNAFFMLSREQVDALELPAAFVRPIMPSPRKIEGDEIFADEHGEPQIAKRCYLLACDLPEHEVRQRFPALWRYLEQGRSEGVHERYLSQHRNPWYAQENRAPAPFLCTYMGRTNAGKASPFRFILNHSQAIAANVYLMLYPKPGLTALLGSDPARYRAVWQALASITAATLTGEGRVYGGGLHKLEPKELANVPADVILTTLGGYQPIDVVKQLALFGD